MRPPSPSAALSVALVLTCLTWPSGQLVAARRPSPTFASVATSQAPARQSDAMPRVDAEQLMQDVRALSAPELEGRLTGNAGSLRAQRLIVDRFTQLKLQPVHGSYEQKFSFTSRRGRTPREFPSATNLMAAIRGSKEPDAFILVTAHYDHHGVKEGLTYHGADDNASGVAAMLAIAGWFAAHQPLRSLLFVAFDGEEHGLQGSRHFVANPPIDLRQVSVVVNLDMLGRGDKNVLYVAGTYHAPALKAPVLEASTGRHLEIAFGHDRPGVQGMDDWTHSSDHGPFHSAGIPFLYFGVEEHPDYHKPTDTADKIPVAFYHEATELVLETIERLLGMAPLPRAPAGVAWAEHDEEVRRPTAAAA